MPPFESIRVMQPKLPTVSDFGPYFAKIEESGIYSNRGPLVSELEARLARHFGIASELVVVCANATVAIQGALDVCPRGRSNTWRVPSWTFAATGMAALQSNVNFEIVDCEMDGLLRTKVDYNLVQVLTYGGSPDLGLVSDNPILVDAAASFDSLSNPDFTNPCTGYVLSLHATKILQAGEGGVFFSNDLDWVNGFRSWINFGFDKERHSVQKGTNAKLSEFAAGIALASLDLWPTNRLEWLKLANLAKRITNECDLEIVGGLSENFATPYWVILFKSAEQKIVTEEAFRLANIETRNWWGKGLNSMPVFEKHLSGSFTNSDDLASRTLGLPMHLYLAEEDFGRISQVLKSVNLVNS